MQAYYIENAFWYSEGTQELRRSLVEEAARQGLTLHCRTNADFVEPDSLLGAPPAALFWDKDIRLAMRMEAAGMRLYNTAQAIQVCDDKTLTWLKLQHTGIPMPDTLLVPATFASVGYLHSQFLEQAADVLGLPFVVKEGCGSFGQQVYLAHTVEQAAALLARHAGASMLLQRFVQESAGRDVRAYLVGGRVVASILRQSHSGDFRANIAGGGSAKRYTLSQQEEQVALDACRHLGLDFGGVDLLFGAEGPLLCEVNSNAHFRALREVTGVDPAQHIIRHVLETLP